MNIFRSKGKEDWISKALKIKSQVTREELLLLYELAKENQGGCVVEIGSYHGRSTVALCEGVKAGYNVPVYVIDPHEDFTGLFGGKFGPKDRVSFFKNMLDCECVEQIRLINISSELINPMWVLKVGLLWIDGDHTYEGVSRDFNFWREKLTFASKIAFHDSIDSSAGPFKLIQELVDEGEYEIIARVGLITVLKAINK